MVRQGAPCLGDDQLRERVRGANDQEAISAWRRPVRRGGDPTRRLARQNRDRPEARGIVLAFLAAALLVGGCLGSAVTVKGEIRDDGITLERGAAPPQVRYDLRNVGRLPCDVVVAYTSLAPDELPVRDGRVVLTEGGGPDAVSPDLTYESPPDYILGRVDPGESGSWEVALERLPATGERMILCNAVGDYERGRYTVLRFER